MTRSDLLSSVHVFQRNPVGHSRRTRNVSPRSLRVPGAVKYSGLSRSKLYELLSERSEHGVVLQPNKMTSDHRVAGWSPIGCMPKPESLTRESIPLLKVAYALLMRILGPTVELGRIRSGPSLTSAYPSEDFGYTTMLV
jgi:predicted DNA-binding transcriptional regulator AlpA